MSFPKIKDLTPKPKKVKAGMFKGRPSVRLAKMKKIKSYGSK